MDYFGRYPEKALWAVILGVAIFVHQSGIDQSGTSPADVFQGRNDGWPFPRETAILQEAGKGTQLENCSTFAGPLLPLENRTAPDVASDSGPGAILGDMDALFATHRSRIYRYALLSLRDPELAESLTHDCLMRAFNARAQFRGDCSVATWLTRIATNLIRDHVRSRKLQFWKAASQTAVDTSEIADRLRSPGLTPEASLLVREQVKSLWDNVEKLSANQRSVFLLRFVEELELSEIAAAMGMNIGTVKSHLHRALVSVRSAMEKSK